MSKSDVESLLPYISPFTLPEDPTGNTIYDISYRRVMLDVPEAADSDAILAISYYVAHLLTGGSKGGFNIQSEKIDDYSISYRESASSSSYLDLYKDVINAIRNGVSLSPTALKNGTDRTDTLDYMDIDTTGILDDSGDDEFV